MSSLSTSNASSRDNTHEEMILVVKRQHLFPTSTWEGLRSDVIDSYLTIISTASEFQPRHVMEQDLNYKQIIPYLIFQYEDKIFLMQRTSTTSEQRLQNKYTIGIGGHMRQEDLNAGTTIFDWAKREFEEEVSYDGSLKIATLGVLNDESNDVGQVHLGLVLILIGNSPHITIKSELKQGNLIPLIDCFDSVHKMETWSQIAFMSILKQGIKIERPE